MCNRFKKVYLFIFCIFIFFSLLSIFRLNTINETVYTKDISTNTLSSLKSKHESERRTEYIQKNDLEKENQEKTNITEFEIEDVIISNTTIETEELKTPSSFLSYIVSVRVDFSEETEIKKAISDIGRACSIIRSAPVIRSANVVEVKGIGTKENGEEILFEIER